eukprot:CAMPEP_0115046564 /NCGR_PEP_ID=MMETSP0216-20121206/48815_1 /TAXON_ID=223996 /ORGANISM="Protocruzia adherens, Strain Boccale" /LENGTH=352 /DNA_ID=CAMNT_0002429651 /DNA_START=38 /DNA_END=1096 /DNA_ORIENTATION=-
MVEAKKVKIEGPDSDEDVSFTWVKKSIDITKIEQGIILGDFPAQSKFRKSETEFRLIKRITETEEHLKKLKGFDPANSKLNRYNDIIPFKKTSVTLKKECKETTSTYINANYINGALENEKGLFIATQGPTPSTVASFWQMVWEHDCTLILMLCGTEEGGMPRCEPYFPCSPSAPFSTKDFEVNELSREEVSEELIIRKLDLVEKEFGNREIDQIHYTGWPDQGAPDESQFPIISKMVERIIAYVKENPESKIIVHCSAGVGRTGSIITIYNNISAIQYLLQNYEGTYSPYARVSDKFEFKRTPRVSIFGNVRRLREQRWGMVQTEVQYEFLYRFLDYWIQENILAKYPPNE